MSSWLTIFVTAYFGGLVMALKHPMFPLVAYLTFYYMPPHVNWWGRFLPDLRYSLMAAFALAGSGFLLRTQLEKVVEERRPPLPWLLFFGANTVLVTAWALNRARSWFWTVTFLKLILIYLLIPTAVRVPIHFDVFGAAHVAGSTYWGYKAWDDPKRAAGRLKEVGGPDTQNDNLAAAHLLTVIPFAVLYTLTLKDKKYKLAAAIASGFIINVFILCNSRGATLGFIAGGLAAILIAGKGRRKKLIGVGLAGALSIALLADNDFIRRQQTTTDPQDGSAQSRLVMWKAGIEMVKDHPLGGGGRAFHILSPRYIPEILEEDRVEERSSHNTYVQLTTEWGIQGLILWLGFMFFTIRTLHQVRSRARDNDWYFWRALVIEVGLIGTLTSAFFSNRLYGESIYWLCALTYSLHRMQSTELAEASKAVVVAEPDPVSPLRGVARTREALAR